MATKHPFPLLNAAGRLLVKAGNLFVLWLYTGFFNLLLTVFGSFLYRARMSHNNGIAASGTLRFVDNPKFPLHPFIQPGQAMPCRVRHAAASFHDDAMRAARADLSIGRRPAHVLSFRYPGRTKIQQISTPDANGPPLRYNL